MHSWHELEQGNVTKLCVNLFFILLKNSLGIHNQNFMLKSYWSEIEGLEIYLFIAVLIKIWVLLVKEEKKKEK